MLSFQYVNDSNTYNVSFEKLNKNHVKIIGDIPIKTNGFVIGRIGDPEAFAGDYSDYTTVYRELDGAVLFSNDGSIWIEPIPKVTFSAGVGGMIDGIIEQEAKDYSDIIIPTPVPDANYEFIGWNPNIPLSGDIKNNITFTAQFEYVPTLEEVQEAKVAEMNAVQQEVIQQGVDVTLSDGIVEHFTLTDHDQTSLMGLQTKVMEGEETIPWHTSDQAEHCKYYSNADMAIITQTALQFVTYHVTYFRDLRIYIRALETKTEVEAIYYGTVIPEKYQSEPLSDMLALLS